MKESFLALVLLIAVFSFGSAMNSAASGNLDFEHDEHVGERLRQMVLAGEVPILANPSFPSGAMHAAGAPR